MILRLLLLLKHSISFLLRLILVLYRTMQYRANKARCVTVIVQKLLALDRVSVYSLLLLINIITMLLLHCQSVTLLYT